MKIAILNSYIFPIPAVRGGAVETLIESLVKGANEDQTVELTVFSLYDQAAFEASKKYPRVSFKWLKRPAYIDLIDKNVTTLLRLLKRDKNLWQKNYLWQLVSKRKTRKLLLAEDYDLVIIENAIFLPKLFSSKKLATKYRGKVYFHTHNLHFRKIYPAKAFAGVISVSHFLEKNTRWCFGKQLPFKVVYNGVATAQFERRVTKNEKERLKLKYQIPKDAPVILFVGRIMPKKGVLEVVQAFQKLENTHAHLVIVGASSFGMGQMTLFERELSQIVQEHPRIHATGFVNNQELGKYYALADLVVLPSLWEEPLGLTMIEAQLAGKPLITTNKGGIPETTSATNSILLEVTENLSKDLAFAMSEVLSDLPSWQKKALQAQQVAKQRFSEQLFYQNIKRALKEMSK